MKTVLNLSDIAITLFEQKNVERTIHELKAKKKDFDEIYIGSYFCEKYFLHITEDILAEIKNFCKLNGVKVSLVIPMSSEKDLQNVKDRIDFIMRSFSFNIFSFVVNDFGMLEYISQKYDCPIVLGRLLFKQSRDSRYDTFRDEIPAYEVCSSHFHELIKEYPIKAIELDDVRADTVLANNFGYEIYVHSPVVYMSTGMVCEYASAGLANTKKFRPNNACAHQCTKYCTGYIGANNKQFYKIGRTIYYPGDPKAANAHGVDKEIYFPFESVRESYENSSSVE